MTEVIAGGGGSVATHDLLAVDVGHDRDMLADGQVQHIILVRQRKLVPENCIVEKAIGRKNILCEWKNVRKKTEFVLASASNRHHKKASFIHQATLFAFEMSLHPS